MGYKIIDNYADARRLYDAGLLWYSPLYPHTTEPLFEYPIPGYYMPDPADNWERRNIRYAIQLED